MNGGSGGSSSSTEYLPAWATSLNGYNPLKIYCDAMQAAAALDTAYIAYTGSTFALQDESFPFDAGYGTQTITNTFETDGIKAMAARGRDGHALLTKENTVLADVIKGLKLSGNIKINDFYLKRAEAIIQAFEEDTLPRLKHQYNNIGQFRSIAHNAMEAKAAEDVMAKLSDIGMEIYFGDYIAEKTNQQQVAGAISRHAEQDVVNARLQIRAGELQREYDQSKKMDEYKQWMEQKTGILKKLDTAGNAIAVVMGMSKTETIPYHRPSDISQIAGVSLVGLGIYGQIKYGQQQGQEMKNAGGGSTAINVPTSVYTPPSTGYSIGR